MSLVDKKFFKITNANENHHGFQYQNGINTLKENFISYKYIDRIGGGLHFADVKDILLRLDIGIYLREVSLPLSDPDLLVEEGWREWKANKIFLGRKFELKDPRTFQFLHGLGADIHINDEEPLIWASKKGYTEIVIYILQNGPNIGLINRNGSIPLKKACENGHFDIVKLLVNANVAIEHPGKKNDTAPISYAASNGFLDIVKFLHNRGANINVRHDEPLRFAAQCGKMDVVNYCLNNGGNIHQYDDYAFRLSFGGKHLEMADYMLQLGANIHAGDDQPLYFAVEDNDLDRVKFLVERGVDPDTKIRFQDEHTVHMIPAPEVAIKYGYIKIVNYLLSVKISKNI